MLYAMFLSLRLGLSVEPHSRHVRIVRASPQDPRLAEVGTPKGQCVACALRAIAPFVQVDPRVELWGRGADGAPHLQDAIDNIGA
ncbi:hypothetical protein BGW80DRAFT_1468990 [Lactifluus volemus]|nr:hypothetical protein BGW80DRAFT_1468990 [Lactifluus volemus]